MCKFLISLGILALIVFSANPSISTEDTLTVRFTARVTHVWDGICQCLDSVYVGDMMHGYYVYETDATDQNPSPNEGRYRFDSAPAVMFVKVGNHEFQSDLTDIDLNIVVYDSANGQSIDSYYAYENNVVDLRHPGLWVIGMGLILQDSTGTALANDSLPSRAPILDSWPHDRGIGIDGDFGISARILSISDVAASVVSPHTPELAIRQNRPNPFSESTTIDYVVGSASPVTITVFNVLGQRIRSVHVPRIDPGSYRFIWNGTTDSGDRVPSGIYFYRIQSSFSSETRKLVILR